ncbi:hypothetical protein NP493_3g10011 [Ridgeia piscesae]|uniref:Uncharacterized protein n=1 Tax=Ridgeia piscesae TaxID=27915 RepID=A0AAD9PFY6_RIDPI|nr:hypothetical protein NP493_3g10011 [Ridgeia piscesae]
MAAMQGSPFTDNFLLLTELRRTHLYQVALNGSTVQLRITSTNPMGAVYDPNIRTIFWVSQGDQKVMSSRLDGTELTIIKNLTSAQSPEGIAIDPDEKFIFYTDGGLDTVNLVTYDGKMHLKIVMNAKNPRAIDTDRKFK